MTNGDFFIGVSGMVSFLGRTFCFIFDIKPDDWNAAGSGLASEKEWLLVSAVLTVAKFVYSELEKSCQVLFCDGFFENGEVMLKPVLLMVLFKLVDVPIAVEDRIGAP